MMGTPERDVVNLLGGSDSFDGGGGDDIICGGGGRDVLAGGAGNDQIFGDDDNDYIVGGAGNDRIVGGPGKDFLSYKSATSGITVRNGRTIDGVGHDVTDTETIEGTNYADRMIGGAGNDDLRGLTGEDVLAGGPGNDYLSSTGGVIKGGPGSDYLSGTRGVIRGGAGGDFVDASGTVMAYLGGGVNAARIVNGTPTVVGGRENDKFSLLSRGVRAVVRGGGGNNQIVFLGVRRRVTADIGKGLASWSGGSLKFSDVHIVVGTSRADLLIGSNSDDAIYGGAGDDVVRLGAGNDRASGQAGKDVIDGGKGVDYCRAEIRRNCEG